MNVLLSQVIHVYQIVQDMLGVDGMNCSDLSQIYQKEMLRCDLGQMTGIREV